MFKLGLTSISFRSLSGEEIIKSCRKAGLDGIEWGGDIHVPHGDLEKADEIRKMTVDAGLEVSSYGSYYRAGISEGKDLLFKDVLDTAKVLHAPVIRVWAGEKDMEKCSEEDARHVVEDSLRIADMAAKEDIGISFEYHGGTLTNTNENALKFAHMARHENLKFYWQPPVGKDIEYCGSGLKELLEKNLLANVHVFHWTFNRGNITRHLLEEGSEAWGEYLEILKKGNSERYLLFEFFKDSSLESFYRDAECLKALLN